MKSDDPNALNALNVLGTALELCSSSPMTGWFRNGYCETAPDDHGRHVVSIEATAEFLEFSKRVGNDLSTPLPAYGFPGLKPGDRWCLCADRWREALEAGVAPPVVLKATEESALEHVALEHLKAHSLDFAS